jgi:hypothetical protein
LGGNECIASSFNQLINAFAGFTLTTTSYLAKLARYSIVARNDYAPYRPVEYIGTLRRNIRPLIGTTYLESAIQTAENGAETVRAGEHEPSRALGEIRNLNLFGAWGGGLLADVMFRSGTW